MKLAYDCLYEVWSCHRDPESSDYNKCDEDQCAWCDNAKIAMAGLAAAMKQGE